TESQANKLSSEFPHSGKALSPSYSPLGQGPPLRPAHTAAGNRSPAPSLQRVFGWESVVRRSFSSIAVVTLAVASAPGSWAAESTLSRSERESELKEIRQRH